jgi:hypothetical protein
VGSEYLAIPAILIVGLIPSYSESRVRIPTSVSLVVCETYNDLSTELHLHGWEPKLAACYFNMNLNNAYKILCFLYKKYHPERPVIMPLNKCIHNLTHSLLQRGDPMRKRGTGAPPNPTKDITTSSSVDGRKVRKDSKQQ